VLIFYKTFFVVTDDTGIALPPNMRPLYENFSGTNTLAYFPEPTRVEHRKGASIVRRLGLPANIRLGWKSLPRTNTL
jgi:hypothetical protein